MLLKTCRIVLTLMVASAYLLNAASPVAQAQKRRTANLVQYVNPFIGTGNSPLPDYLGGNASGNTFPGATMPFGMVQWSPDTEKAFGKDERGSYLYADTAIRGFSLTHLSGPGCPVFGDVPFIPFVGEIKTNPSGDPETYLAKFSHTKEQASPGFYEVTLETGVNVKLTTTTRTGFGVFTFPSSSPSAMLIDAGDNATGVRDTEIQITGDKQISGAIASGGFCGTRNKYKLYFIAEFSHAFTQSGMWKEARNFWGARSIKGAGTGSFVTFDTSQDQSVEVRVGISYVSVKNALLNLATENRGLDFETVRRRATARWNNALSSISVNGGTDAQKQVFYTALYHTLLHPNVFSDANGEYLGFDDRVHKNPGHTHYTNFSGWDIYRSESPLIAWLFPEAASDMAQSLVLDAQQGGGLPIWPVANDESGAMYGDPSVPIIASSYAFGAREFDTRAALKAMIKGATDPATKSKTYPQRNGLEDYLKYGYIPMEQKGLRGSPSVALEYEIADFALAQFAKTHGDMSTYREMMRRAQLWTRIFDPQTRYIRGRWADGSWLPGFDFKAMLYDKNLPWRPESHKSYVEGNAVQYTWMIPHNIRGLFDRIGGNEEVIKRLDSFFTELNAGPDRPYFFIGNEPVFPVPWLYNYAGVPWKTQAITRRALIELFTATPGGIPGNDDLGATSSWVVFATVGLYPIIPGIGGFAVNSPLFPEITVRLKGGKQLRILASGASARTFYVQELRLNSRPYNSTWLPYEKIAPGAMLEFKLGNKPNTQWASDASAAPPSYNDGMEGP